MRLFVWFLFFSTFLSMESGVLVFAKGKGKKDKKKEAEQTTNVDDDFATKQNSLSVNERVVDGVFQTKCPSKLEREILYYYEMQIIIGHRATVCTSEQQTGIAGVLRDLIDDVFGKAKDVRSRETRICPIPTETKLRQLEQTEEEEPSMMQRQLAWGRFLYKGGIRCLMCPRDNRDKRVLQSQLTEATGRELWIGRFGVASGRRRSGGTGSAGGSGGHGRSGGARSPGRAGGRIGRPPPCHQRDDIVSRVMAEDELFWTSKSFYDEYIVPQSSDMVKIMFDLLESKELDYHDYLRIETAGANFYIQNLNLVEGEIEAYRKNGVSWAHRSITSPGGTRLTRVVIHIPRVFYQSQGRVRLNVILGTDGKELGFHNVKVVARTTCMRRLPPQAKAAKRPAKSKIRKRNNGFSGSESDSSDRRDDDDDSVSKNRNYADNASQALPDEEIFEIMMENKLYDVLTAGLRAIFDSDPGHCMFKKRPEALVNLVPKDSWEDAIQDCVKVSEQGFDADTYEFDDDWF